MIAKSKLTLKLLAPYLAVTIFCLGYQNAWLSILVYHAQILFWSKDQAKLLLKGFTKQGFVSFALPCLATGLMAYFLLPFMYPEAALAAWLASYKLEGLALLLMIPYFGVIHPPLEQMHWAELRENQGLLAHVCFAGYHAIVLFSLLNAICLALVVVVLLSVSMLWAWMHKRYQGLAIPALTHIFADAGIIVAAFFLVN